MIKLTNSTGSIILRNDQYPQEGVLSSDIIEHANIDGSVDYILRDLIGQTNDVVKLVFTFAKKSAMTWLEGCPETLITVAEDSGSGYVDLFNGVLLEDIIITDNRKIVSASCDQPVDFTLTLAVGAWL